MSDTQTQKEKTLNHLRQLAKGRTPIQTKRRLTMDERLEYLADFRRYAENVCMAIVHHQKSTPESAHQDKHIENFYPIENIGDLLDTIDTIVALDENAKDGNHHKAGRYFRAVVNHYHDIAVELTKISDDFTPAFANPKLHVSSRFDLKTKPNELKEQFEKLLLTEARRGYNRLEEYQPKHD